MRTEISVSDGTLDAGSYRQANKYFLLLEYKFQMRRNWSYEKLVAYLEDNDEKRNAIVEVVDDTLVVSVLRTNSSDVNSFVEVRIGPDNPLHKELKEAISALNIIDVGDEIEGVGYCAGPNMYQVQISKDLHAKILNQ